MKAFRRPLVQFLHSRRRTTTHALLHEREEHAGQAGIAARSVFTLPTLKIYLFRPSRLEKTLENKPRFPSTLIERSWC